MAKIEVCDICGKVHKNLRKVLGGGLVCKECHRIGTIDDLRNPVLKRVENTYNRLKAFEELGVDVVEIKNYLNTVEESLKGDRLEIVRAQIIGNFEKVSELETTLIFANFDDLTNKMQQADVALRDENEKSKKQTESLEKDKAELSDQINNLSKENEELNEYTNTLTNENKKLKNQIKNTEKKLKEIKEQKREEGFQDDFSDKSSGWDEYSDGDEERKYEDGEYHILVKKKNRAAESIRKGAYSDFILEVDARQVSGPVGYYGLVFREEAADKFYRFSVSGNSYCISKWFGISGLETFKDWTKSEHIKKGKEINRLKVIAYGSQIMVFVNDEYLATVTDSSIVKGGVSIVVGAWNEPNVHVHFDNFKVSPIG